MQNAFSGRQGFEQGQVFDIDNLYLIIIGEGKINPDVSCIGSCHHKDRLSDDRYGVMQFPGIFVDDQNLMLAYCGCKHVVTGYSPTFKMRHFINGQFFVVFAVVGQYVFDSGIKIP